MSTPKKKEPAAAKPAGGVKQVKKAKVDPVETIDIAHEVVDHQLTTTNQEKPPTPAVISADEQIKLEIKKFGVADAGIAKMKEEYGALTITGVEDKAGYEAVKKAWRHTQSTRTGLEGKGLELRNYYSTINKGIIGEEKRLITLVSPLEDELYKKWKAIDDEKDRLKKEKEAAEEKQLQDRLKLLIENGMAFTGAYYEVVDGNISADVVAIRSMTDEQFDKLTKAAKQKFDEVEQARKDKLEQERLAQEKLDAEKKKLKEDQEKLDKDKLELEEQKKEMARAIVKARLNELGVMGITYSEKRDLLVFDNGHSDFTLPPGDVLALKAADYEVKLRELGTDVDTRNQRKIDHDLEVKKEQEELERKQTLVNEELIAAGFTYQYNTKTFEFKNRINQLRYPMDNVVTLPDEAIKELAAESKTAIDKWKEAQVNLETEEKATAEKLRLATLDDDARFNEYLDDLVFADQPDLDGYKQEASKKRQTAFFLELQGLTEKYRPAMKKEVAA